MYRSKHSPWKKTVLAVALVLFTSVILVSGSGVAFAQTHSSFLQQVAKIQVPLRVDCAKLSARVLKEAQQKGLCSTSTHSTSATPDTTASGNCGSSWLYITDNYNNGHPTITIGAASSQGYMVYISWHVKWVNFTTGGQNGYGGSQGYFGDTWSSSAVPYTGVGQIYAILDNLTVLTAYGYYCYGLQPYDYAFVG